jgi:hypothetical protein
MMPMRVITKKNFFDIFSSNTSFPLVERNGVQFIHLSAYEAFIFSTITGSGYLDDEFMPFTPKGLMKIFQSVESRKFVTGLVDQGRFCWTPKNMTSSRPYLSSGDKLVTALEFETEKEYQRGLAALFSIQENRGDIIVQRIERSKKGSGMEPLIEYFNCQHFKSLGYVVDNQAPLTATTGSPDWVAMHASDLYTERANVAGHYLFEPALRGLFSTTAIASQMQQDLVSDRRSLVGEVKVVPTNFTSQVKKYLNTGLFHRGIFSSVDRPSWVKTSSPCMFFDDEWRLVCDYGTKPEDKFDPQSYTHYQDFMRDCLKIYSLSIFPKDRVDDILNLRKTSTEAYAKGFLDSVAAITLDHVALLS